MISKFHDYDIDPDIVCDILVGMLKADFAPDAIKLPGFVVTSTTRPGQLRTYVEVADESAMVKHVSIDHQPWVESFTTVYYADVDIHAWWQPSDHRPEAALAWYLMCLLRIFPDNYRQHRIPL